MRDEWCPDELLGSLANRCFEGENSFCEFAILAPITQSSIWEAVGWSTAERRGRSTLVSMRIADRAFISSSMVLSFLRWKNRPKILADLLSNPMHDLFYHARSDPFENVFLEPAIIVINDV